MLFTDNSVTFVGWYISVKQWVYYTNGYAVIDPTSFTEHDCIYFGGVSVAHLVSLLCCPIIGFYGLSSVL